MRWSLCIPFTLAVACSDMPTEPEYVPVDDGTASTTSSWLGSGGRLCNSAPAFAGSIASLYTNQAHVDFVHYAPSYLTQYTQGASVWLDSHDAQGFTYLHFWGPRTTTDGQGCIYLLELVRWRYMRTHTVWPVPPGTTYSWKTSTQSSVSLSGLQTASDVLLDYRIKLQEGPLFIRLYGPSSVQSPGFYTYSVDVEQGSGAQLTAVWEVSRDGGPWIQQACYNDSCPIGITSQDTGIAVRVTISDGNSSATAEGNTSVNTQQSNLVISISGPNVVNENEFCYWFAEVSGGTEPYQYTWSGLASGQNESVAAGVSSPGTLYLQVQDAANTQREASLFVDVDPSGSQPSCTQM